MPIDLNSDLGESYGAYTIGDDETMMKIISSANIACGFHAGDPLVMHRTLALAKENGVGIGAHPSFIDTWGFGRRSISGERPEDIEKILIYQIGALQGMAHVAGSKVAHFKAHGALSNAAAVDPDLAAACARAVKAMDPKMIFVAEPRTELEKACERVGLPLAREAYADRAYDDLGILVPREVKGAVLDDPAIAVSQVVRMVEDGVVISMSGKRVPIAFDTICVHGDNPAATEISRQVRHALMQAGIPIEPMSKFIV